MTEWDATAYNRLNNPMQTWGEAVVAQLPLRGDETALDLKPGAWLIAQCGGGPNIARVRTQAGQLMTSEPYRAYFGDWTGPWEFASAELTAQRLTDAGFVDVEASMFEAPVQLESRQATYDYFEKVIFGTHLSASRAACVCTSWRR